MTHELDWLDQLVKCLASGTFTRACYIQRADTRTTVRVFAELDKTSRHVAKLFVDAYTSRDPSRGS